MLVYEFQCAASLGISLNILSQYYTYTIFVQSLILIVFFDCFTIIEIYHAMKQITSTKFCTPSNQHHVPLVGLVLWTALPECYIKLLLVLLNACYSVTQNFDIFLEKCDLCRMPTAQLATCICIIAVVEVCLLIVLKVDTLVEHIKENILLETLFCAEPQLDSYQNEKMGCT